MFAAKTLHSMDPRLFQRLTTTELDGHAAELEQAMESHIRWFAAINRTLLCHTAPHAADLAPEPHHHCQFGRWYDNIITPVLRDVPEFFTLGLIHEQMHRAATQLLEKSLRQKPIGVEEYDRFIHLSDELRQQLNQLRAGLRHNISLISSLMGKVFENATEGVMITDPQGTILRVNQSFSQLTGYAPEEVIGKTPNILKSGKQGKAFYRHMWLSLAAERHWEGEIWNRRKDGGNYLEWLSITAVSDEQDKVTHYVAVFSDITGEKESEERLYRLAHYDLLTALPNRMLFHDRLTQALLRARRHQCRVAVMFLDLDGFKQVNDRLGHQWGDELLRQVAQRLSTMLRASDTVSRFGGDEFTLIIPDLNPHDDIRPVAQKIVTTIAHPYALGNDTAHITTSIGISLFPDHGDSPDALVSHADMAMYQAKKTGKNQFQFFTPDT